LNNANDPVLGAMHAVWKRMAGGMAGRGTDAGRNGFSASFRMLMANMQLDSRIQFSDQYFLINNLTQPIELPRSKMSGCPKNMH